MSTALISSNSKFLYEANITEFSLKVLSRLSSAYALLYKLPFEIIQNIVKLILSIIIGCLVPFAYPVLVIFVRKSNRLILELKNEIPSLTISELEQIKFLFQKLETEKGLNIEMKSILSKSPIILRPISYVIKENLDNLFELKDQIDTQIENDLKLFVEGLDADLPI